MSQIVVFTYAQFRTDLEVSRHFFSFFPSEARDREFRVNMFQPEQNFSTKDFSKYAATFVQQVFFAGGSGKNKIYFTARMETYPSKNHGKV